MEAKEVAAQSGREATAPLGDVILSLVEAMRGDVEAGALGGLAALEATDRAGRHSGGPRGALALIELSCERYREAFEVLEPVLRAHPWPRRRSPGVRDQRRCGGACRYRPSRRGANVPRAVRGGRPSSRPDLGSGGCRALPRSRRRGGRRPRLGGGLAGTGGGAGREGRGAARARAEPPRARSRSTPARRKAAAREALDRPSTSSRTSVHQSGRNVRDASSAGSAAGQRRARPCPKPRNASSSSSPPGARTRRSRCPPSEPEDRQMEPVEDLPEARRPLADRTGRHPGGDADVIPGVSPVVRDGRAS